jgi:hypothetical protein
MPVNHSVNTVAPVRACDVDKPRNLAKSVTGRVTVLLWTIVRLVLDVFGRDVSEASRFALREEAKRGRFAYIARTRILDFCRF